MKHVHVLCLFSAVVLGACSDESSTQPKPLAPSASAQPSSVSVDAAAKTPDYIKVEDIKPASADAQATANNPAATESMSKVAADTINNSQLSAQQKANMNEKVQTLMAAKGNSAQMAAAGNALIGLVTGGAGVKAKIPGFGLLDPAAAVAAVQDLINAIVSVDPAGIQDAIMDLIAALV